MFRKVLILSFITVYLCEGVQGQDATAFRSIAEQHRTAGNNDSALWYYKQAFALLKHPAPPSDQFTQLCNRIGGLYFRVSQYNEAAWYFEEGREASGTLHGDQTPEYANICNTLGVAYNLAGHLDSSVSRHLKARTIRAGLFGKDTSAAYAQSCNNLGSVYRDLGRFSESESLLQEAYNIRKRIVPEGKAEVFAITCAALGHLYQDIGQYDKAEKLYREARAIRAVMSPAGQHPEYAAITNILADLLSYMQQREEAEKLYMESLGIRAAQGKDVSYAESCNNISGLYREWGRYTEALFYGNEARMIFERDAPEGSPARTINLNGLGETYLSIGNLDSAKFFLYEARKYWGDQLDRDHPYLMANASQLIRLYRKSNQPDSAHKLITSLSASQYAQVSNVFQFTSETEKLNYLRNTKGSSDEFISFYWQQYDHSKGAQAYTLALQNRNLVLSSLQAARQAVLDSGDPELTSIFNLWSQTKGELAKIYQRGADRNIDFVSRLQFKADSLEKLIARNSGALLKTGTNDVDWKAIQQKLEADEASVEFVSFRVHDGEKFLDSVYYAALVLRKDFPEPKVIGLFEETSLVDQMKKRSNTPVKKETIAARGLRVTSASGLSQAVYQLVWKNVEPEMTGIKRVYFAPAGLLHRVSFAALPVDSNTLLSDRYQLVQLSSTAGVVAKSEKAVIDNKDQIQLVGAVQYGVTQVQYNPEQEVFEYLPGAESEVAGIEKLAKKRSLQTTVYRARKANENELKSGWDHQAPEVLHIATHGFFFPEPVKEGIGNAVCGAVFRGSPDPLWRSGLVLANGNFGWCGQVAEGAEDGILSAYEVSGLSLVKTKLLVLSACETALGDVRGSEGVYGLQRAFRMAGVANMVMSLWKVPDNETAEFMTILYEYVFGGMAVDQSFYLTQEKMKTKYRTQPYKWAAWVLIR